ncbi:MAG: hypothetical protein R2941_20995 [Desulfobacterales bacterium]
MILEKKVENAWKPKMRPKLKLRTFIFTYFFLWGRFRYGLSRKLHGLGIEAKAGGATTTSNSAPETKFRIVYNRNAGVNLVTRSILLMNSHLLCRCMRDSLPNSKNQSFHATGLQHHRAKVNLKGYLKFRGGDGESQCLKDEECDERIKATAYTGALPQNGNGI